MTKIFPMLLTCLFLFGNISQSESADFQRGLKAYKSKDYQTAIREWKPLAEQGNVSAQFNLGVMYENEQGVPKNDKTMAKWYRLAAEQGHARAQVNLGFMYENGQGVPKNYKTAMKWYRLAAEQGDADAQTNLGYMYEKGQGVPKNYKTAAKWYKLSADQGETTGMSNLGELYYLGKGVSPNLDKAFDLLKEAALKGNLYSVALLLRIWEVDMSIPYKLKYNFYVGGHKKQFYISVNPYFPNVHTRHVNLSMKPLTITVSTNNDHVKLKFTKKQMMEATQNAVSIVNKKLQETIKLAKPTRDDRGRWGLHFNTHISQLKNCEITANVTSVFEEIVKAKDNLTKFFCKVTDEYGDKLERYAFGDDDGFVFQITTYIDGYTSATYIETHEILSKNYKVLYTPKGAHYEKMLENRAVPYSLYENNKDNKKPKYIFLHLTGSDIWVSYFDKKSGEQIKSKIIPTSKIKKRRRL